MLLRQDQRQTISQRIDPKLIMANAILQQTSIELVQQIQTELLENPALEVVEEDQPCGGTCIDPESCPYCSQRIPRTAAEKDRLLEAMDSIDVEPEVYADGHLENLFDSEEDFDPIGNLEAELTLQDHLRGLIRAALPEEEHFIGAYLIDCLDDNGWLATPPEEIARELCVDVEEVCRVLATLQSFDPPGVAARDLRECLLLQLRFLREEGKGNLVAERMIERYFADFVNGRFTRIARAVGVSVDKAKQAKEYVKAHLNPFPANQFRPPWAYKPTNSRAAVRADVIIRRTELGYEVKVVGTDPFILGVNPSWRDAYNTIKSPSASGQLAEEEKKHVTEYVERAELFIRNIHQRRKTLRLITKCIIDCQQGFLETGSRAYLRPLTRTKVAEMLGMHESTVSRATAKKFVQLPNQEVIAFDVFFNPSLSIKTFIEEIIANEDPSEPLSDQQIADMLKERGIDVARRTVVKYRESQKLLSSTRRRR